MRLGRALVVAVVLLVVAIPVIPSAFAWLWPILGFGHSCLGYPIPNKPLPGTPQWPFFPDSGQAVLVRPGAPFCPINGFMSVGPVPPIAGRPYPIYVPGEAPERNETVPEKNITQNQSSGSLKGEWSAPALSDAD